MQTQEEDRAVAYSKTAVDKDRDHKWLLTVQNNNKGYNIKEIVDGGTHTNI
jgi:hypothetical protein